MFLHQNDPNNLFKIVEAINASSILTMTDVQGRIVQANANFEKMCGYSLSELLGKNHSVVNSGHHPRAFWVEMWRTIATGSIWHGEICNRAKNGSTYWVDTFIYPIQDDAGKIMNYFSVRNDITEKKLLTSKIISSERKLKALFDGTSDIFFLLDAKGFIEECNESARQFLMKFSGDVSFHGRNIFEFVQTDQDAVLQEKFQIALSGAPADVDCNVTLADTSAHWYSFRFSPAADTRNEIYGITLSMVDIDHRKRHELTIEENNKALLEIAWIHSHEIRGPVATLMGLMNLLENDSDANVKAMLPHFRATLENLDTKIRSIVKLTY